MSRVTRRVAQLISMRRRGLQQLVWLILPVSGYRAGDLVGWKGEDSSASFRTYPNSTGPHGEHEEALQSQCVAKEHTEYWGDVVKWGADNVHDTAEQCCEECRRDGLSKASGCNTWVWCGQPGGCGGERRFGECWLKRQSKPAEAIVQAHGEHVGWTSGVLLSEEEAKAKEVFEAQQLATYLARKNHETNAYVFFDIAIDGMMVGRIEFVLYMADAPRAAENFRQLCTGEKGVVPAGHEGAGRAYSFEGKAFYRIIDQFIDQTGAGTDSVYGGQFKDDPGGLAIKHDRPGLLSMANSGPDTNTSHFSILVNAAPHLNGAYTVFGEVTSGLDVVYKINKLANKDRDTLPLGKAVIVKCGELPRPALALT